MASSGRHVGLSLNRERGGGAVSKYWGLFKTLKQLTKHFPLKRTHEQGDGEEEDSCMCTVPVACIKESCMSEFYQQPEPSEASEFICRNQPARRYCADLACGSIFPNPHLVLYKRTCAHKLYCWGLKI